MLLFCPHCANALTINPHPETLNNRLICRTCPYAFGITAQYIERKPFYQPEKNDTFGGEDEYKNAPKIEKNCTNLECSGRKAVFRQQQTRSADEGSTLTFLCITCGHSWREYT